MACISVSIISLIWHNDDYHLIMFTVKSYVINVICIDLLIATNVYGYVIIISSTWFWKLYCS